MRISFFLLLCLFFRPLWAQEYNCTNINSLSSASILIPDSLDAALEGNPLPVGSVIKVLYNNNGELECGGYIEWQGENTILNARGSDGLINGFAPGEAYRFAVTLPDGCTLLAEGATFQQAAFITGGGAFQQDGISLLTTLELSFTLAATIQIQADTCNANTGAAFVDGQGGAPPYSIAWADFSDTTFSQPQLSAGAYGFTLTDAYGCSTADTLAIPFSPCPALTCNATCNGRPDDAAGCVPFQVNFTDASSSEAGIQSWQWDFGDGNTSNDANPAHIYQVVGAYTATLTIDDGYRTSSKSFEIDVFKKPEAAWSATYETCFPNQVSLEGESEGVITNWNWVFEDGQQLNASSGELQFEGFNTSVAGTLFILDTNGCSNQLELILEIPEAYDLEISDLTLADPSCGEANGSIEASISGGAMPYDFDWLHDDALENGLAEGLLPGAYAFTITDANGCSTEQNLSLEDNTEVPQPELGQDTAFCEDVVFVLDGHIANATFQWFLNEVPIPDANAATLIPSESGSYRLEATNQDGCTGTDEVFITLYPMPQVELGETQRLCPGDSLVIDASCPDCTYLWNTNSSLPTVIGIPGNSYAVTVANAEGCTATDAITIEALPEPEVSRGENQAFCEGTQSQVLQGPEGEGFIYLWSTSDTGQNIIITQSGSYSLTVINQEGCSATDEVLFEIYTVPTIDLPPNPTLCPADSLLLSAACPGCTYAWNDGQTEAQRYAFASGSYAVTATNAEGCSASDTISLEALPQPEVALGPDAELCTGETLLLDGPTGPGYTYLWSTGATTRDITLNQSGQYTLSVTNAEGCTGTDAVEARYLPEITAEIIASATEACPGDTIALMGAEADWIEWIDTSKTLVPIMGPEALAAPNYTTTYGLIAANACSGDTAYYTIKVLPRRADAGPDTCIARGQSAELRASGAAAYYWLEEPFTLSAYDIPNPVASPDSSTWYRVAMEDSLGCRYVDSVFVEVINLEEVNIPLINVITPNGDGQNDRLVFPLLTKFSLYKLTVFNRWGETVYQSLNYQNDWEGRHKGKPLPAGAYFYVLKMGDRTLKSSLTIIRE